MVEAQNGLQRSSLSVLTSSAPCSPSSSILWRFFLSDMLKHCSPCRVQSLIISPSSVFHSMGTWRLLCPVLYSFFCLALAYAPTAARRTRHTESGISKNARCKRFTANLSLLDSWSGADNLEAIDDTELSSVADSSTDSAKSWGPGGEATHVQEADQLPDGRPVRLISLS